MEELELNQGKRSVMFSESHKGNVDIQIYICDLNYHIEISYVQAKAAHEWLGRYLENSDE